MLNLIAVPYKFYSQIQFIVEFLKNNYNIIKFNKSQLSLEDSKGNKYFLFNDPNKVYGFEFKQMIADPQFTYDSLLIDAIKSRIRVSKG